MLWRTLIHNPYLTSYSYARPWRKVLRFTFPHRSSPVPWTGFNGDLPHLGQALVPVLSSFTGSTRRACFLKFW